MAPSNYGYSMPNLILHPTKPIKWWKEVEEWISATHTSKKGQKQYFGANFLIFPRRSPWTMTIQCKILDPTKSTKKPLQVEEWISARHTSRTGSKTQYIKTNLHIFPRRSPWNYGHSMQSLVLHPTQIDGANVRKKYPNPLLTLLISYMYLVFVMGARNL
jgi:hypothetical protein